LYTKQQKLVIKTRASRDLDHTATITKIVVNAVNLVNKKELTEIISNYLLQT
jgi:hypothetical protein